MNFTAKGRNKDNNQKQKSLSISDKINILAQVDADIGTRVELASWLRLSVSMLSTIVKNREETERSYVQRGPFSKQQKALQCSHWRNWNLHLLHCSTKHMRVILPQMAPTSRRRPCTLLLILE
jgi:hypothetical protein